MNTLITGGSGFIGQHLVRRLAQDGHRVIVYDVNASNASQDLWDNANVICNSGDIQNVNRLREVLSSFQVDYIVHLATILTAECARYPYLATKINCCGSAGLFEAAVEFGVKRVVYGSSVAVFNDDPALSTGDDRPYGPPSVYGVTKVFTEQLAQSMQRDNPGIEFLGIRLGWVYGPGRVRGWTEIQEVIENFAIGKKVVNYPDYQKPLDWTYIDDAVEAIVLCLEGAMPGRPVLNFSGDYRMIGEAIRYLKELFPTVQVHPYSAELPPVGWGFKSDGIIIQPGYSFQTGLEQGLLKTIDCIRIQNGLSPLAVG